MVSEQRVRLVLVVVLILAHGIIRRIVHIVGEPLATFEPMIRKIFARPSDDDIDQQVRFGT